MASLNPTRKNDSCKPATVAFLTIRCVNSIGRFCSCVVTNWYARTGDRACADLHFAKHSSVVINRIYSLSFGSLNFRLLSTNALAPVLPGMLERITDARTMTNTSSPNSMIPSSDTKFDAKPHTRNKCTNFKSPINTISVNHNACGFSINLLVSASSARRTSFTWQHANRSDALSTAVIT